MQPALPPKAPRRLRRYFLLGILFELILIALGVALPESWLQTEIRNFIVIPHAPLLAMSGAIDNVIGAILFLLFALAVIGTVWGFVIYWLTRFVKTLSSRYIVSPRQKLVWRCGLGLLGVALLAWAAIYSLPATPVQLAHACHAAGFASVVPASWGDELIAAAVLARVGALGSASVIQCSCPLVAHRLLAVGGDLRSAMISLVSPPVALARYLRESYRPTRPRITFVGRCAGAVDDSIDAHLAPEELLALFSDQGIVIEEQPSAFESVIPPQQIFYFFPDVSEWIFPRAPGALTRKLFFFW